MSCTVLMYHVIDLPRTQAETQWCCEPARFSEQMAWLADAGYQAIGMPLLQAWLQGEASLPSKAVCITFDDGTDCLVSHALPVLVRHGFPAHAFIVSGRIGADNDWLQQEGWSRRLLLDANSLRMLPAQNVGIGSHSVSHADLTRLQGRSLASELQDSRASLQDLLGLSVRDFAYPYGRLTEAVRNAVAQAGYEAAFTVADGRVGRWGDRLRLNRVEIFHWDNLSLFERKLRWAMADPAHSWRTIRSLARRAVQAAGLERPFRRAIDRARRGVQTA